MDDEGFSGSAPTVIDGDPNVARHQARRKQALTIEEERGVRQSARMAVRQRVGRGLAIPLASLTIAASMLGAGAGSAAAQEARQAAPARAPTPTLIAAAKNEEPRIEVSGQTEKVTVPSDLKSSRDIGDVGDVLATRMTGRRQDGQGREARERVTEVMAEQVATHSDSGRPKLSPIDEPPTTPSVASGDDRRPEDISPGHDL